MAFTIKCSQFPASVFTVWIKLLPTCLTCVGFFAWSANRNVFPFTTLCVENQWIYTLFSIRPNACLFIVLAGSVIIFSRNMVLLGVNLVRDSSCVYKGKEQCVLRWECKKQQESQAACLEGRRLKREIGVSIKCGRHRRGCFLLVKVYRKSGDGAALSPVVPHHKSHFPLFKLQKFGLVNLPRFAIGNFELLAFISQPALVKSCFLLNTFFPLFIGL